MSVYFCLVVVALLVPVADSAVCEVYDEFDGTFQIYNKEIYCNVVYSVPRQMTAFTTFVLDKNNKSIVLERKVIDHNLMVQFDIPANAPCTMTKIKTDMLTEIPDNAISLHNFPLPLPDDLSIRITYWRFKWSDNNDVIVGVVRSLTKVCSIAVWGPFNKQKELIVEEVAYIRGDYSLRIRNMDVFYVPTRCLSGNDKST